MRDKYDVIIIGAGPAGIFTAMELTKNKENTSILIVEKGKTISQRKCPRGDSGKCLGCYPCSITSGFAGAGTFSDGKLTLTPEVGGWLPEYIGEEESKKLIKYVDDIYLQFGADSKVYGDDSEEVNRIKYEAQKYNIELVPTPIRHLGTEKTRELYHKLYNYLLSEGVDIICNKEVENLMVEDNKIKGVAIRDTMNKDGDKTRLVSSDYVVVAPGREGSQWLQREMKRLGIPLYQNEVDIGVRVEVPNSVMDHLTKHLYESKFVYYSETFENRVRTFCMNPSGVVSPESYDGKIITVNGHSYKDDNLKTENTNFALLVSTKFTEPFDDPISYGKYIASLGNMLSGGVIIQRLGDLLKGRRTTYERLKRSTTKPTFKGAVPGDLSFVLPHRHLTSIIETLQALDKIAPGLYGRDTLLYGVEAKFYSSRLKVNNTLETEIKGLYAAGDGCGITRGIIQASTSGVVIARDIAKKLR